jgi:drug/metabolite transporter (DMT)-like permease
VAPHNVFLAITQPIGKSVAMRAALPVPTLLLRPAVQGMAWMVLSGAIFGVLNALLRVITLQLPPIEAQFLRYVSGALVMLPFILRVGFRAYHPNGMVGQLWRGAAHTSGMLLWFMALPHLPLADTTAIGFTGPIFVMVGAVLVFHEPMLWRRWISALIGFGGVLIVVGPKLSGSSGFYDLVMLASAPLFAASQLITKALTKRDRPEVIVVWQCLTISLFSFPLAMLHWVWPSAVQYGWFLAAGILGSCAHYCATQAFRVADVSATQPVRFLDLIWATLMGFLVFGDVPTSSTRAARGWDAAYAADHCATSWRRVTQRGRWPAECPLHIPSGEYSRRVSLVA